MKRLLSSLLPFLLGGTLHAAESTATIEPSVLSKTDFTPYLFSLPAPRGLILDRTGQVLAGTVAARQLTLSLNADEYEGLEAYETAVKAKIGGLPDGIREKVFTPDRATLADHFQFRRRLPLVVSEPLHPTRWKSLLQKATESGLNARTVYLRDYPNGPIASHILGYLATDQATPTGPVAQEEPMWREMAGKAGIEASFDELLRGQNGLVILKCDQNGEATTGEIIREPVPGNAVVLTLDLEVQRSVEKALAKTGRSGAAVVLDARNGDVLASASFPDFDPGLFASSISQADFSKLVDDPEKPLYDRAISGAYPPGSVFKPITAIAALNSGAITPQTRFDCGPELEIDGRVFRNWSENDEGQFDLSAALIRSCNTYFYQTAIFTRDRPILEAARSFGFARAPRLPLPVVAAGTLPEHARSDGDLANLSIGQGEVTASPIQIASMMSAFSRGQVRPEPRLVSQIQTPDDQLVETFRSTVGSRLGGHDYFRQYVNTGLWGVVNHERGTAKAARHDFVPVYGKTGTAQWQNHGKKANVVWFTGFVPNSTPPISFAVAVEGKPGESLFGGSTAAPVASQFLHEIFSSKHKGTVKRAPRSLAYRTDDYPLFPAEHPEIIQAIPVAEPVLFIR